MRHHFVRSSTGLRDPNFKNVTLLLHGDGTNGGQNNTFLDSSGSNNAITRTGNVAQGSFSPYGDRWSNYFDGNTDWLKFNSSGSAVDFTGAYTIECFFWLHSNLTFSGSFGNFVGIIANAGGGGLNGGIELLISSSSSGTSVPSRISLGTFGSASPAGLSAIDLSIPLNTWHHVVFTRDSSNNTSIFLNGSRIATAVISGSYLSRDVRVAGNGDSSGYQGWLPGYISNLRVVKGSAVYDPTLTSLLVPNKPLTAITNTTLLTCQSNRFADSSSNNFSVTRTGDVSVQRFSPFSPDAQYRTDRIGGSAYFDGSDYLLAANRALRLESGFFTVECWVYLSSSPASDFFGYTIFSDYYWSGGNTGGYFVTIGNNGKVNLFASSGASNTQSSNILASNNSITHRQWNHIAIVRGAGNLINIYINGVSTTTPIARTSLQLSSGGTGNHQSMVGARVHDTVNIYGGFIGIISDVRVINGKCLYTANFTPPTEPLKAIPETTFLGRFANGSIVDNAMMSNIETVGNAQISTSIKKCGTGALYFDGTGDYLTAINNPTLSFGTGDFTIEAWVYIAANSTADSGGLRPATIFGAFQASGTPITNSYGFGISGSSATTGTGLYFSLWQSGTNYVVSATTTVSQSTWHHIAVARSGTLTKLFLNGSEVGSGTLGNQNITTTFSATVGRIAYAGYLNELNGYIDDLRVTNGLARYTSNFTPPTAPFPDF